MIRTARIRPALAALVVLVAPAADASPKPCRDPKGRVIECAKAPKPLPPRCKDATGRFVNCDKPGAQPDQPSTPAKRP